MNKFMLDEYEKVYPPGTKILCELSIIQKDGINRLIKECFKGSEFDVLGVRLESVYLNKTKTRDELLLNNISTESLVDELHKRIKLLSEK